jgi:alkaline phosphatase
MKRTVLTISVLLLAAGAVSAAQLAPQTGQAKYVFFFIGDGMGFAQVHSAEAYLNTLEQGTTDGPRDVRANLLAFTSELPYAGAATTYDYGVLITDSASAGTALACGKKTYSGVVSVDPETKTVPYPTIAELAKAKGMRVGIVSSVSIDHATPAVFYAHTASRKNYHEIEMQLGRSGFDYFGGGGFLQQIDANDEDALAAAQAAGYQVVHTRAALEATQPGQKVLAINQTLDSEMALPYEVDRDANDMSLADFTSEGIRLLDNPNGFFMMVEGGKIDWTCHANDARTSIGDVLAFDAAVQQASAFATLHPAETLIVVTADHETGGMTMGWAGTPKTVNASAGYASNYEMMVGQTMSYEAFSEWLKKYQADPQSLWNWIATYISIFGPADADMRLVDLTDDKVLLAKIEEAFGLDYAALTDFQKSQLEEAYDRQMAGEALRGTEEDYLLYGGYDALTVTCTHLLNNRAGVGWTSYSHTAIPVPVMSNGATVNGYYDNTDIAKKIAASMGVSL